MSFQGTKPEVELKVKFQKHAKVIRLDVSGEKSEPRDKADFDVLWFMANFRHDLSVALLYITLAKNGPESWVNHGNRGILRLQERTARVAADRAEAAVVGAAQRC